MGVHFNSVEAARSIEPISESQVHTVAATNLFVLEFPFEKGTQVSCRGVLGEPVVIVPV